ncbi:MAG: quinoprotein [Cereibacter sphaeroides]|uniref:Quinoprotein n=1 Tax=Cereibacter sphaeroides TaxID=1063 RepID=A0A2W5SKC4_CERSP|nr:MAG: quinoprotein [Cereibacter sphaeroides]
MRNVALAGLTLILFLGACAEKEVILQGERFDTRTPLDESIPTEGQPAPRAPAQQNRSEPISLGAPVALGEWTHRGSNVRHLPPNSAISSQPVRIWTADIGEADSRRYRISTIPVVAGGRVFTMDARTTVTATSTGGGMLWQVNLAPNADRGNVAAGGGLAYGEGKLFVTSAFGELLAIDPATGGVIWRQRVTGPMTGAPTVADGIVYAVARDNSAWAVNAADGKILWQFAGSPTQGGMVGGSGPAVTDRLVLFPLPNGQLVAAMRQGGFEMWRASVVGNRLGRAYALASDITADPVVAGNVTFVGNSAGRTVALDTASGEQIWAATEGAVDSVAVGGGSVFLVNDQAQLVRLNAATGEVIWTAPMPYFVNDKPQRRETIYAHYGPVLAGGRVVVASSDGLLRFFSPTDGALVGTAELPGGAATPPVVVGGTIYVVSTKGQLHAFR